MSTALSTIINEVLPDVIGCPYPLVEQAVRESLQDFCSSTWIINRTAVATSVTTIDVDYALDNWEVCELIRLKADGVEYSVRRLHPADVGDEMDDLEEVNFKYWYPVVGGSLTILPFSVAPAEVRVHVAFSPTMLVDTVEDQFYHDWHDTIVYGAKAKLLLMPKKAWSDIQFGQFFKKQYEDHKLAGIQTVRRELTINEYTFHKGAI
jgi:hypothetical protein